MKLQVMAIEKITGIVIDTIKHSDKYNILTLYTRERGRMTFLSSASGGKSGRVRKGRLMPLAVVQADIKLMANKELQYLGSVTPVVVWHDLYYNPMKSALVMFLTEFLNKFLRQSVPDSDMWDYIFLSLRDLDITSRPVMNRHLAFLIGMLPYSGIEPKLDKDEGGEMEWFDMRDGALTNRYPAHRDVISPQEIPMLKLLTRMKGHNSHCYRFSRAERGRVLDELLHYYGVHYPGVEQLKTLETLRELFA